MGVYRISGLDKWIYTSTLPKLDLTTDAQHVANLVNVPMLLLTCNSAVYYMGMLYLHNDIYLTDIVGCDRLTLVKFIPPK